MTKDIRFLKGELAQIRRRTNINYHGENLLAIAKKLKSPLTKEFTKINKLHNAIGYLPYDLSQKRYKLYQRLMAELKNKSPQDYEKVYSRL